jgi:putative membrane protein
MTEALLAFVHISAILGWVVFASSQAALCREDWFNPAALRRLRRLDAILWTAATAVLLTGLARTVWGARGLGWYWSNSLLHLKLTLFVVVVALMAGPTRCFARWQAALNAGGALPDAREIRAVRWRIMLTTHLVALIPLAAVFLARGYGGN